MRQWIAIAFTVFWSWGAHASVKSPQTVLMVLTSHSELYGTGKKTGFWFEELSTPYYLLTTNGFDVVLASVKGGNPPVDPRSLEEKNSTATVKRFQGDPKAMAALASTLSLSRVKAEDYTAIVLVGGHGAMWDFIDNVPLRTLVESFIQAGKPVAAICHGPAALLEVRGPDGQLYARGRRITAFTAAEEKAIGLDTVVSSYLDAQFKALGAQVVSAPEFQPNAVQDGLFITGQNPASSGQVTRMLINTLRDIAKNSSSTVP